MFDLSALVILTLFNLIAVLQVVSSTTASNKFQDTLTQGTAVLCLAVSLVGLGLAMLVPTPGMGIATVSIAALVNLLALLGPSVRRLSDPQSVGAVNHLRGLARLYLVGTPYVPAAAGAQPISAQPAAPASVRPGKTASRPISLENLRGVRSGRLAAIRIATDPSIRAARAFQSGATTRQFQPAAQPATRPAVARSFSEAARLNPRSTYTVPRRPNWLPPTSLAFLLSVENEPDIFADARQSMSRLPALAKRVRLVSTNPNHPAVIRQNANALPATFAEPDPGWATSYARLAAVSRSA